MKIKLILTTTDTKNNAEKIASALVRKNISPCVQILPQSTSIYNWKGEIKKNCEYIVLIKLLKNQKSICKDIIIKMHTLRHPRFFHFFGFDKNIFTILIGNKNITL